MGADFIATFAGRPDALPLSILSFGFLTEKVIAELGCQTLGDLRAVGAAKVDEVYREHSKRDGRLLRSMVDLEVLSKPVARRLQNKGSE